MVHLSFSKRLNHKIKVFRDLFFIFWNGFNFMQRVVGYIRQIRLPDDAPATDIDWPEMNRHESIVDE